MVDDAASGPSEEPALAPVVDDAASGPSEEPALALVVASPRVAPGLLTRDAWRALERATGGVFALDAEDPLPAAVAGSGIPVTTVDLDPPALARHLVSAAATAPVAWLGSPDGDPGLTDAVAAEVSRLVDPPDVEVVVGSWDVPGARLLDVVAVMDRLRSPGGCPWDAAQTHETLAPYLLEEAHEAVEAIETGDRRHMVEELGDVLLQVAFHARVGEEHPTEPFTVDDVAATLVAKLLRRHPHVFADGDADTPEAVEATWEQIKAAEREGKPGGSDDDGIAAGIPVSLPALERAQKVLTRMRRRDLPFTDLPEDGVGGDLLTAVRRALDEGVSAEAALRASLREVEQRRDGS